MKINIKNKDVIISDEKGNSVSMTTEQLLELVRTINTGTNQAGFLLFTQLEFTF